MPLVLVFRHHAILAVSACLLFAPVEHTFAQYVGPPAPQPWVALLPKPVAVPVGEPGRQFDVKVAYAPSQKISGPERQAWDTQMRAAHCRALSGTARQRRVSAERT